MLGRNLTLITLSQAVMARLGNFCPTMLEQIASTKITFRNVKTKCFPFTVRPTLHISKMLPKLEKGRKTLQMKQRVPETYRRTPPRLHPYLQHHSARASWDLSGENLKLCDFGGEIMWNLLVRLTGLNLERKTSLKSWLGVPTIPQNTTSTFAQHSLQ